MLAGVSFVKTWDYMIIHVAMHTITDKCRLQQRNMNCSVWLTTSAAFPQYCRLDRIYQDIQR